MQKAGLSYRKLLDECVKVARRVEQELDQRSDFGEKRQVLEVEEEKVSRRWS